MSDTILVKVSNKMANLPFNGCDPEYIKNVCHASCCQSSKMGTMITIHPTEEINLMYKYNVKIENGFLQPTNKMCKKCPFKTDEHLCNLHGTDDKPFGCIASPFTLNKNGTLIVRNRYKLLKCYNDGKKIPAYQAFRGSLVHLFGEEEAERLTYFLGRTTEDIYSPMNFQTYNMLLQNDEIKKNAP